jgi:hypothetical protein
MKLDNGEVFPPVRGLLADGGTMTVPDDLDREWLVVLFYRGHW